MAYSDFTLEDIKKKFQLLIRENLNVFAHVESVDVSDTLQTILQEFSTGHFLTHFDIDI